MIENTTKNERFAVIVKKRKIKEENYKRNIWIHYTAEVVIDNRYAKDDQEFENNLDSEIDRCEVNSRLEAELVAKEWNSLGVFEVRKSLKEIFCSVNNESSRWPAQSW